MPELAQLLFSAKRHRRDDYTPIIDICMTHLGVTVMVRTAISKDFDNHWAFWRSQFNHSSSFPEIRAAW